VPEQQRADAGAGDIERRGRSDVSGAEADAAAGLGQAGGDRSHDRHLESVESEGLLRSEAEVGVEGEVAA